VGVIDLRFVRKSTSCPAIAELETECRMVCRCSYRRFGGGCVFGFVRESEVEIILWDLSVVLIPFRIGVLAHFRFFKKEKRPKFSKLNIQLNVVVLVIINL